MTARESVSGYYVTKLNCYRRDDLTSKSKACKICDNVFILWWSCRPRTLSSQLLSHFLARIVSPYHQLVKGTTPCRHNSCRVSYNRDSLVQNPLITITNGISGRFPLCEYRVLKNEVFLSNYNL